MKRIILGMAIVSCFVIVAVVSHKSFIRYVIARQLGSVCNNASVSVGQVSFNPLGRLSVSRIVISRPKTYDLAIGEAVASFSFVSLLQGQIEEVLLRKVHIAVATPRQDLAQLMDYFSLGPSSGGLRILRLRLDTLTSDIRTKDLFLSAEASCDIALKNPSIASLDLLVNSCESHGLRCDDLHLAFNASRGDLQIRRIVYNKLALEEINGAVALHDNHIVVSPFFAKVLNGSLKAPFELIVGNPLTYTVTIEASAIDLARIVKDFDLEKKFRLDGALNGTLTIQGRGNEFSVLQGSFDTVLPGGMLTITDTQFLQNVAQRTQQSIDIVAESFKDFAYTNGAMRLSLQGKDVAADIVLTGKSGKRSLNITVHDFSLSSLLKSFQQ